MIQRVLCILMSWALLCNLSSCTNDDVDAILDSGVWNVGNFYGANNWSKINDNGRVIYTSEADLETIRQLNVTFLSDGTLNGHFVGGTFTGRWTADGDSRTIHISQLVLEGIPRGISELFIKSLTNAAYYKGDSNYLKLAPEDRNSYVQLAHYTK